MSATHTPTPWHEATRGPNNMPVIGAKGLMLAHVCTGYEFESEANENAKFIVRACNAHEKLVSALKRLTGELTENDEEGLISHSEAMAQALAALEAAGEE